MSGQYAIDDAAAAALWSLKERPTNIEHLGVLYGDDLQRSNIVTAGSRGKVGGSFSVPEGSLRAVFHNHTPGPDRAEFSVNDKMTAKKLGQPSYISAGDQIFRYDPQTGRTEEVLAQIPIAELKKLYLAQKLTNP